MSDEIDEVRHQVSADLGKFFEKALENMGDSDSGEQSGRESQKLLETMEWDQAVEKYREGMDKDEA